MLVLKDSLGKGRKNNNIVKKEIFLSELVKALLNQWFSSF